MKISGVYKITNTITNDFYIGSSKNIKHRWTDHKCPSRWSEYPNSPLYKDMQKYGVDKFDFQVLASVDPEQLKEVEQQFIEMLKPTYNSVRAKGLDKKEYTKKYQQSDKYKEYMKNYYKTNDTQREKKNFYNKKYCNQLCSYNGETLTLNALYIRFRKSGIEHPIKEAKKYLILN